MCLTDGQTDTFLIASPHWHSMRRGKKTTVFVDVAGFTWTSNGSRQRVRMRGNVLAMSLHVSLRTATILRLQHQYCFMAQQQQQQQQQQQIW